MAAPISRNKVFFPPEGHLLNNIPTETVDVQKQDEDGNIITERVPKTINTELPTEVLSRALFWCQPEDRNSISKTCRNFNNLQLANDTSITSKLKGAIGENRFEELLQKARVPANASAIEKVIILSQYLKRVASLINNGAIFLTEINTYTQAHWLISAAQFIDYHQIIDPCVNFDGGEDFLKELLLVDSIPNFAELTNEQITTINQWVQDQNLVKIFEINDILRTLLPQEYHDLETIEAKATSIREKINDGTIDLSGITRLDLYDFGLTAFPPELGNLSYLQELFLSDNQLQILPPEFGNLSYLQTLFLSHNQLQTLPPEIGDLSSLKWFFLSDNQLQTLPPELGNLSRLQALFLHNNPICQNSSLLWFLGITNPNEAHGSDTYWPDLLNRDIYCLGHHEVQAEKINRALLYGALENLANALQSSEKDYQIAISELSEGFVDFLAWKLGETHPEEAENSDSPETYWIDQIRNPGENFANKLQVVMQSLIRY